MRNLALKIAILETYGNQSAAALDMKIDYGGLSRIINGWRTPTPEQHDKLVKAFGERKVREFFADDSKKAI